MYIVKVWTLQFVGFWDPTVGSFSCHKTISSVSGTGTGVLGPFQKSLLLAFSGALRRTMCDLHGLRELYL